MEDIGRKPDTIDAGGESENESENVALSRKLGIAALASESSFLLIGLIIPFVGFLLYIVGAFIGGILALVAWRTLSRRGKPGVVIASVIGAILLAGLFVTRCMLLYAGASAAMEALASLISEGAFAPFA